jgi:hypothetical protein
MSAHHPASHVRVLGRKYTCICVHIFVMWHMHPEGDPRGHTERTHFTSCFCMAFHWGYPKHAHNSSVGEVLFPCVFSNVLYCYTLKCSQMWQWYRFYFNFLSVIMYEFTQIPLHLLAWESSLLISCSHALCHLAVYLKLMVWLFFTYSGYS